MIDMHRICSLIVMVMGVSVACPSNAAVVPGGLVSSHNRAAGLSTNMEVTMTVESAPPSASSYFWAQQFFLDASVDHGGYFGIQTGGVIEGEVVGKMLIFSIWNAVDAEAGPNAVAQTFGGEGVGYSVRKPLSWEEGVAYTFRLEKDEKLWWKLSVVSSGQPEVLLGRIKVTEDVLLKGNFTGFAEYFRGLPSCSDLPYAKASLKDLVFNGRSVPVRSSRPYGRCIDNARGSVVDGKAVYETGVSF